MFEWLIHQIQLYKILFAQPGLLPFCCNGLEEFRSYTLSRKVRVLPYIDKLDIRKLYNNLWKFPYSILTHLLVFYLLQIKLFGTFGVKKCIEVYSHISNYWINPSKRVSITKRPSSMERQNINTLTYLPIFLSSRKTFLLYWNKLYKQLKIIGLLSLIIKFSPLFFYRILYNNLQPITCLTNLFSNMKLSRK